MRVWLVVTSLVVAADVTAGCVAAAADRWSAVDERTGAVVLAGE